MTLEMTLEMTLQAKPNLEHIIVLLEQGIHLTLQAQGHTPIMVTGEGQLPRVVFRL